MDYFSKVIYVLLLDIIFQKLFSYRLGTANVDHWGFKYFFAATCIYLTKSLCFCVNYFIQKVSENWIIIYCNQKYFFEHKLYHNMVNNIETYRKKIWRCIHLSNNVTQLNMLRITQRSQYILIDISIVVHEMYHGCKTNGDYNTVRLLKFRNYIL